MKRKNFVVTSIVISLVSLTFASMQAQTIQSVDSTLPNTQTIAVEPTYTSENPRYGMVVFGANNEKMMWMVLDKSDPASNRFDRMFVDLNCNFDLTESEESFNLKDNPTIILPGIKISDDSYFSNIGISLRENETTECMIKAAWSKKYIETKIFAIAETPEVINQEKSDTLRSGNPYQRLSEAGTAQTNSVEPVQKSEHIKFGGGFPLNADNGYMLFTDQQSDAPVVHFKGGEPFEFQPWYPRPFVIGDETDFKVFMGHLGKGHGSFCTTLGHILPPGEPLLATLNYVDSDGNKKRAEVKLTERC